MRQPTFTTPLPRRRRSAIAAAALLAALALGGCGSGGTPWGATPQRLEIPVPDLRPVPEVWDGVSGSTAGAQRVAQRVRAALAAEPALAGVAISVEGFESGLIVLGGALPSPASRALAVQTARRVNGVREVVDRMTAR